MVELKGYILGMGVFVIIVIPIFLFFGISSIQNNAFMKHTTEHTEIVKAEGGLTPEVARVTNSLVKRGYAISFKDGSGKVVTGKVDFGETVVITYKYNYKNVRGNTPLNTVNRVFIQRR